MKKIWVIIFILIFSSVTIADSEKPFETALILGGGGVRTAMFIGQYDAALDAGKKIDLLIGSCGGSIGAAIIKAFPDRKMRREIIRSEEFFELYKKFKVDDGTIIHPLYRMLKNKFNWKGNHKTIGWFGLDKKPKKTIPDIYNYALVNLEEVEFPAEMQVSFENNEGPAVIIVASEVLFDEEAQKSKIPYNTKLYTETYFTDETTAQYLRKLNLKSPVGSTAEHSFVMAPTQTLTGVSLNDAVMASIADPYLILPYRIGKQTFTSGAINLDPTNITLKLAKETIARYPTPFDNVTEIPALKLAYGYDPQVMRAAGLNADVTYWIDLTAVDKLPNFMRKFKFNIWNIWKGGYNLENGLLSKTHAEFVEIMDELYDIGYKLTSEALKREKGSKKFIENPYHDEEEK